MQNVRACACARIRIYSTIPRFPRRLLICIPAHLHICTSVSAKRANSPARLRPGKSALCPPAGTNGHVRRPRAQNCAIFFARRNALAFSELRPFQEKFPKISPKFLRQKFGVCAKSPYLCTRKTEMRPTTPHKSEAIRSLKTLHKTIL